MKLKRFLVVLLVLVVGSFMFIAPASSEDKPDPLAKWAPAFDPKGAKFKCVVSNVSTPALVGT